jgi:hypothetical protein
MKIIWKNQSNRSPKYTSLFWNNQPGSQFLDGVEGKFGEKIYIIYTDTWIHLHQQQLHRLISHGVIDVRSYMESKCDKVAIALVIWLVWTTISVH